MMIRYRSRFLTRGEVWFDNDPGETARTVDWILYRQRSHPLPGMKARNFYTLLIDLSQPYEQLQAALQKGTADKIRRARERDKIACEFLDPRDPAVMDRFERMYNAFASIKGLAPLCRSRLEAMGAAGVLEISVAKDREGNSLLYHANYRDASRVALMELPSLYRTVPDSGTRNLIGRANRYLIWTEILRAKEAGLRFLDFGGWYSGTNPAMNKINEFKRGFGGRVVREFQCEAILTLRGWLVLTAAAVRNGPKRVRLMFQRQSATASAARSPGAVIPTAATALDAPGLREPKILNSTSREP